MKAPRERGPLNMRTVAQRAGVSSATVSRVINGSPAVKEETAAHVRRILKELNFIPNPIATTLKYGRSNTYGLIIPDLANPFYPEFLLNFEEALVESDYELLLATTQSSQPKLINSVRRMVMRHVDGVVVMASEYDTRAVEPLLDRQIPIVTIDRGRAQPGSGDVSLDFEDGYRQAVHHLYELGHKRIGFIGGNLGIHTSAVRVEAFRKAVVDVGLTFDERLVRAGDYRVSGGDAAMTSMLMEPRRPTAVVTANDLTAFGALRALHARGIQVPKEMSIVGFDGIAIGDAVYPALTTVASPSRELAQSCLRALNHCKQNATRRGLLLSVRCSLLLRASTDRAPSRSRA